MMGNDEWELESNSDPPHICVDEGEGDIMYLPYTRRRRKIYM